MNKVTRILSVISLMVLISILAVNPALAQSGSGGQSGGAHKMMSCDESFTMMDTNKDGKISKDEFSSGAHTGVGSKPLEDSFKASDTSGDGMLTKDEFCASHGMHGGMHGHGGMPGGTGKSQ
jgi:Ca2+-binding EF-hand superfamily protein